MSDEPPRQIDRATARRFLVTRHLLAPPRSVAPGTAGVMRVVERLAEDREVVSRRAA